MPVRKVFQHGKNIIGLFPSLKMGRMVAFESLVERDTFFILDYERSVTFFEEQPFTISYRFQKKVHTYTPDVRKVDDGRNILVECKPEDYVNTAENQVKFAAAREWCQENNSWFELAVAEEIRSGFRLNNIKTMTLFARHCVPDSFRFQVCDILTRNEMPLGEIGKQLTRESQAVNAWILSLAFHHVIEFSLDNGPIGDRSIVRLGDVA